MTAESTRMASTVTIVLDSVVAAPRPAAADSEATPKGAAGQDLGPNCGGTVLQHKGVPPGGYGALMYSSPRPRAGGPWPLW
jgi:hypothetical protein